MKQSIVKLFVDTNKLNNKETDHVEKDSSAVNYYKKDHIPFMYENYY
jgi:hypothetical protein